MSAYKTCEKCGHPMAVGTICQFCQTQDGWTRPGSNPQNTTEGSSRNNAQNRGGGSGGNACFAAGTKIHTPSGARSIETLTRGDAVFCWSRRGGEKRRGKVLRRIDHAPSYIAEVYFDSGNSLLTTRAHSVLTNRGWTTVSRLRAGDLVVTEAGARSVRSISYDQRTEAVYNLVTLPENTFIADGVVAHNFTYFRTARSLYWRIREQLIDYFSTARHTLERATHDLINSKR
jgi:hypothetical protein